MDAGGVEVALEERIYSSCSSFSCDSEKWETSEDEGTGTKSKSKVLPEGFLDPLPPQKPFKLPRLSDLVLGETTCWTSYTSCPSTCQLGWAQWNQQFIRQLLASSLSSYRDELDGLLDSQVTWEPYTAEIQSQVADICLSGQTIWLAHVPLVAWTRVEWHLPDRVLRQFGFVPTVDVQPMEPKFVRVDGRGKADTDWLVYYLHYIGLWEDRRAHIIEGTPFGEDTEHLIQHYLQWFRHWILQSIGVKWRNYKASLKSEHCDSRPIKEIKEAVPAGVDPTQWCQLVNQWAQPEDQEGLTPEDGNLEANERVFKAVMGPEHPGRVRTQGFGVTPTRYFPQSTTHPGNNSYSSTFARVARLEEQLQTLKKELRQVMQHCQGHHPSSRSSNTVCEITI
ncbi:hypothetical protein M5K25_025220 [Dendrobium thyrsiflorum]|uniref:Aminotransferase-like plant mobile domain-containing protein n=1 Tax=Dendrobium thyrsiflorum TaxID=117978 RepID=A0ABD0U3P7_DENTH